MAWRVKRYQWVTGLLLLIVAVSIYAVLHPAGHSPKPMLLETKSPKTTPEAKPPKIKANKPQTLGKNRREAPDKSMLQSPVLEPQSAQKISALGKTEQPPDTMLDAHPGEQRQFFLSTHSVATPGKSKSSSRTFAIPDGWNLVSAELIRKQGRGRVYEKAGLVHVEIHALALDKQQHQRAYATAKIVIEKQ